MAFCWSLDTKSPRCPGVSWNLWFGEVLPCPLIKLCHLVNEDFEDLRAQSCRGQRSERLLACAFTPWSLDSCILPNQNTASYGGPWPDVYAASWGWHPILSKYCLWAGVSALPSAFGGTSSIVLGSVPHPFSGKWVLVRCWVVQDSMRVHQAFLKASGDGAGWGSGRYKCLYEWLDQIEPSL